MKKIMEEYLGVILLYSVIVFGVVILNARFKYLNHVEVNEKNIAILGGQNE